MKGGGMFRTTLDFTLRAFVTWMFRARPPELTFFMGAVAILVPSLGANFALSFSHETPEGGTSLEVSTSGDTATGILGLISAACVLIIGVSLLMGYRRFTAEMQRAGRKRVVVLEGRGLRDDDGSPLSAAVPSEIPGTRIPLLLDLRQKDGVIRDPEELLELVCDAKKTIRQLSKDGDRSDLALVYGGLTAVPFTFLTGILLDDEGSIFVMDWDRSAERWRALDGEDDGVRFETSGLDALDGARDVVLAVSVSYFVKEEDIRTAFVHPVVRLTLPDYSSSHWSPVKQSALADDLFAVLKHLDAVGVARVHLLLAAPNSVAFNFGRRYDKRNLPAVIVYQYERSREIRYPWGVEMPVAGLQTARVVSGHAAMLEGI
ncbi:SAVED domain-containing protein [Sinorhizobium meliloti]|nr:SAVED domain-containing protein [Sinorhizobium meliloti]MDW9515522.1 SAVED domain-containing protein [Sinorhizobium meliloti]MDX0378509.1 SAVED domain-containing protein [Sinorhizobium meliloti]